MKLSLLRHILSSFLLQWCSQLGKGWQCLDYCMLNWHFYSLSQDICFKLRTYLQWWNCVKISLILPPRCLLQELHTWCRGCLEWPFFILALTGCGRTHGGFSTCSQCTIASQMPWARFTSLQLPYSRSRTRGVESCVRPMLLVQWTAWWTVQYVSISSYLNLLMLNPLFRFHSLNCDRQC